MAITLKDFAAEVTKLAAVHGDKELVSIGSCSGEFQGLSCPYVFRLSDQQAYYLSSTEDETHKACGMTEEQICKNIEAKKYLPHRPYPHRQTYPETHVFDATQTVLWNKEKVAEENAKIAAEKKAYREEQVATRRAFEEDVISYIQSEYGQSKPQAQKIFGLAWEQGHASGYYEVLAQIDRLAEILAK